MKKTRYHGRRTFAIWMMTLLISTLACDSFGQAPESQDCNCLSTLENLVSKLEADYIGYQLGIRGKREAEYRQHLETARNRARHTADRDCIFVMHDFIRFFRDGHLFVAESPKLSDEDLEKWTKSAEQIDMKEKEVREYLESSLESLDPIEGIWYDKSGYRIGIIRDSKGGGNEFVGILLTDNVAQWRPGQVKARFKKLPDGSYDPVLFNKDHYPLHPSVYLRGQEGGAALRRKGLLLHIAPLTWGKAFPLKPDEKGWIDPADPRRPLIRVLSDAAIVVSVPSHSPEYRSVLNDLVEKNRDRILQTETLIVDLRGDEGGGTGTTNALIPFILSSSKGPSRFWKDGRTMVLSSPDTISYFKSIENQGWIPKDLVGRMRQNKGQVLPFHKDDTGSQEANEPTEKGTDFPRHVAILIDGAVVGAGEAAVIGAMKFEKVTLFGENSGGVIDYQSVNMVRIPGCPPSDYLFGFPMFAASDQLPLGGVNATGIPPDVPIGPGVKDLYGYIIGYYSNRSE